MDTKDQATISPILTVSQIVSHLHKIGTGVVINYSISGPSNHRLLELHRELIKVQNNTRIEYNQTQSEERAAMIDQQAVIPYYHVRASIMEVWIEVSTTVLLSTESRAQPWSRPDRASRSRGA